jgi:putative ribosome biogenesis GTPase RsgA
MRGTALSGTGGIWRVLAADGVTYECAVRGRIKQSGLKLAVGDDVELERVEGSDAFVGLRDSSSPIQAGAARARCWSR